MTPAARLAAAMGILDTWLEGTPVERSLTAWARGARYAGSKDRAAVRDHVFDILRRKGACSALGGGETGRGLVLGLVRLQGGNPDDFFTGEGHAPDPLTADERAEPSGTPDPWLDVPQWLQPRLKQSLGAQADRVIAAMQDRAPLFLRAIHRGDPLEHSQHCLSEDGIETEKCDLEGALLVTSGGRALRRSQAFLTGLVEPQDLSVQIACAAVDWPQSGRILDYCAGGGGKTLALGDLSDAGLFVHDANPARLSGLAERAARTGLRYRELSTADLAAQAPFDAVLCDVPCSGSGTWRRDPEAKWHLTPERLSDLQRIQAQILSDAAALVAPEGRLVYMTCSVLRAENEDIVAGFLRRGGWHLTQALHLTPVDASDGFYMAELTRDL